MSLEDTALDSAYQVLTMRTGSDAVNADSPVNILGNTRNVTAGSPNVRIVESTLPKMPSS